jgi:hypothetical protein
MSTPTITIRDRIRENALAYGRDYLSSAEAAEYLGFAEQTLRGWRAKHRGPRLPEGRRRRALLHH